MASTAVDRPKEAAALRRLVPADGFAFALTSIVWLAASQGGYFPTSWGWAALALAWVAALGPALAPNTPRWTRGRGGRGAAAVRGLDRAVHDVVPVHTGHGAGGRASARVRGGSARRSARRVSAQRPEPLGGCGTRLERKRHRPATPHLTRANEVPRRRCEWKYPPEDAEAVGPQRGDPFPARGDALARIRTATGLGRTGLRPRVAATGGSNSREDHRSSQQPPAEQPDILGRWLRRRRQFRNRRSLDALRLLGGRGFRARGRHGLLWGSVGRGGSQLLEERCVGATLSCQS